MAVVVIEEIGTLLIRLIVFGVQDEDDVALLGVPPVLGGWGGPGDRGASLTSHGDDGGGDVDVLDLLCDVCATWN